MSLKAECAWARVCIRETKTLCSIKRDPGEGTAKFGARVLQERYRLYCEQFNDYSNFNLPQYEFNRVAKKIDEQVAGWRYKEDKLLYLSRFAMGNWSGGKTMTNETRKAHSLTNCKACRLYNSQYQSTFPMKKMCNMSGRKGPLSEITTDANKHTMPPEGIKATKKQLKAVGQTIYSTYNDKCKENFGKSLSDILVLVPEAGLEKKLSPVEKKKLKRDQQRQSKNDIENHMNENDTDIHLNSRESYSARQRRRLAQSFETTDQATERARTTPPKKRERSHTPAMDNVIGDLDSLLIDVESWPPGSINWSEKAKFYKIRHKGHDTTPPNGGQILKSFLQSKGVDIACVESETIQSDPQDNLQGFRVRRSMNKQGGGDISVAVPRTNAQIRTSIRNQIDNGTYNIGVPVVETEITKLAVSNEGQVVEKKLNVHARKIPFKDIRKQALARNKDLLKIRDDSYYNQLTKDEIISELHKINEPTSDDMDKMRESLKKLQRQRHWLLWHDHSTLANYGHMLFCVRELYDPAIHFTRQEILNDTDKAIDVQATVEEPQIYILGQSRSTVEDQMKFVPTRQEDLKDLKDPTVTDSGIEIKDVMRFMNGDNPAAEMEDGTQHGGNYGCPGCDGNINSSYDLEYTLQRKYKTLENKKKMVLSGPAGRKDSFHPFKNMKVNDLKAELRARGMSDEGKREQLQKELSEHLGGTTRLPALLHEKDRFDASVKDLNIESYEVLFFEALHCSMNHIKNVLQELPHHITAIDTLIKLKEILAVQYSKEKLRGVDYRKTLIYVTIALYPIANREVKLLLVTLCEMVEIYYAQDEKRSPKMILRLHNLCYRHAIQCRRVLTPPKTLTYRKLFGLYFHSCVAHSSQLLRLASHRSTNAEMFERLFEKLSDITTKTWSRRIEDLSTNAILHLQAQRSDSRSNCILKEEREISKIAKSLPKLDNTILLKSDLEKYAGDWIAHLRLIADFLKPGEGIWWLEEDDCIEFYDGPNEPSFREQGPQLHHFRSTSISREQELLEACWNTCLKDKVKIPATKCRDVNGKWQRLSTCCLPQATEDQVIEDFPEFADDLGYEEANRSSMEAGINSMEIDPLDVPVQENPAEIVTTDTEDESWAQPRNGTKRMSTEDETADPEQPPAKRKKMTNESETLLSKTAKALEQVLGTCEEVLKYDKLKQNVGKNPKSRYHIERYESHLAQIQIMILKAYKRVHNDVREATAEDFKENIQFATKRKQIKTATELLKLWKITLHLD